MKIDVQKNGVWLKGRLVVDEAVEIREGFLSLANEAAAGKPLVVHCTEVEEIDSAGVQLLLALRKSLKKKNIALEIADLDENLAAILKLAGIHKILKIA